MNGVREMLEHASRENLCDKGMPWPQNHAQIADWILAMNLTITVRPQPRDPAPSEADYPPNKMCSCGVLIHPDMPNVVPDMDSSDNPLWHEDENGWHEVD